MLEESTKSPNLCCFFSPVDACPSSGARGAWMSYGYEIDLELETPYAHMA